MFGGASATLCRCWQSSIKVRNLELQNEDMSSELRCKQRFSSLRDAMDACLTTHSSFCGGITLDNGINCGGVQKTYELRTGTRDLSPCEGHSNCRSQSWLLRTSPAPCAPGPLNVTCAFAVGQRVSRERQRTFRREDRLAQLTHEPMSPPTRATPKPFTRNQCLAKVRTTQTGVDVIRHANSIVECLIQSGQPFLIGRPGLGAETLAAYAAAIEGLAPSNATRRELAGLNGVLTRSRESARQYGLQYTAALNQSDVNVRWDHSKDQKFKVYGKPGKIDALLHLTGHWPNYVIDHEVLEPWLLWLRIGTSWMSALRGKTVLVVSPFDRSVLSQVAVGGEKLFGHSAAEIMLPSSMTVKTVRPKQYLGSGLEEASQGEWSQAVQQLIEAVDRAGPFDLALISAGGIGMLLAAHLRATQRSAIYSGGSLQLQFGIRGGRWNSMKEYKELMSGPHWVSPRNDEMPPKLQAGRAQHSWESYWRR